MDNEERAMTMRIALRAEDIRRKHNAKSDCDICNQREQFNDEKEVKNGE